MANGLQPNATLSAIATVPPIQGKRDPETIAIMAEAARRVRMLEGRWYFDLEEALVRQVGNESRRYWPDADISKCLFRDLITQLCVLYDSKGIVTNPENEDAVTALTDDNTGLLRRFWPFMRRHQQKVEGCREALLKIDWVTNELGEWEPLYTTVTPDRFEAKAFQDNPTRLQTVKHWTRRTNSKGDKVWTQDVWSLSDDGKSGSYKVLDAEDNDISAQILGKDTAREWKDANGAFLPFCMYHAEELGGTRMLDSFYGSELVCMTLKVGVYWTFWGHLLQDNSWPVKWIMDAMVQGTVADKSTGTNYVKADPSILVRLKSLTNQSGKVGHWPAGGDPKAAAESIAHYTAEGLNAWGISPAESQRVSADPRSGYAIALSRETIRTHQLKAEVPFRSADLRTIRKVVRMANILNGTSLPATGWVVDYKGIPPSMQEQASKQESDRKRVENKQASWVDIYMEDHGVGREQAWQAMQRIAEDQKRLEKLFMSQPGPFREVEE